MILIAFGTRPEWLKLQSIVDLLSIKNIPFKLLFTGQHTDIVPNIKYNIDYNLKTNLSTGNRLGDITSSILTQLDIVNWNEITKVIVQGDTSSSFSVALGAFYRGKEIVHIEAGLRTSNTNDPFPEEFNRRAIDSMSKYLFCPTEESYIRLTKEYPETYNKIIKNTGNTIIDILPNFEVTYNDFILLTLHRRENWDNIENLLHILASLCKLKIAYFTHPSVKHKLIGKEFGEIQILDPVSHYDFCKALSCCKYVITDSGGVQEEATFYKKKIILCRNDSERKETEAIHAIVGDSSNLDIFSLHMAVMDLENNPEYFGHNPFGDGKAAEKIVDTLVL